jgi:uncharacterized protein YeaO (DUF488 family)
MATGRSGRDSGPVAEAPVLRYHSERSNAAPGCHDGAATPTMNVHTYRYGEAAALPGLSIGVTRRAPRGVKRADYGRLGYGQAWLPVLGPSPALLKAYQQGDITFSTFARRYRAEMKRPEPREVIRLLGLLARTQRINLGCFCAEPQHCHRTLLAELVTAAMAAAEATEANPEPIVFASPACSMPEIED